MSVETERSSTESDVSGLDYEETALTLGIPGGARATGAELERKRGFSRTVDLTSRIGASEDRSDESPDTNTAGSAKAPAPKARVVGWPPVRNYRKNALKSSNKYVKVAVDGAPYLRKVDLEAYGGYEELLSALQEMFSCFTIRNYPNEERKLVDPIHGTEYVPTYEDKDGDWMLVGDVPWKMFVDACKRLRLMKSSEATNLGLILLLLNSLLFELERRSSACFIIIFFSLSFLFV
ncbi:Auxin-responsive protein [Rhynchospora pubera]|uniref:Auxin-responsive protein n=1 Tax=Rhynchospora pubera TaxID=906938 RepID=A0AAV8FV16_9POAL|nr:Auxin-responsive protein [Rhynchospora pubera]